MNEQERGTSPWGEPASPAGASYRALSTGPPGPPPGGRSTSSAPRPSATAAPAAAGARNRRAKAADSVKPAQPVKPVKPPRRGAVLVERTILVRIIPRTGMFARLRAAVALTVIAVIIGIAVAATLSVIVWGVATAIHHAAAS
jgi:hypothetical protein